LANAIVICAAPPSTTLAGENDFVVVGAFRRPTPSVAVAVGPLGVCVLVTLPVVFV